MTDNSEYSLAMASALQLNQLVDSSPPHSRHTSVRAHTIDLSCQPSCSRHIAASVTPSGPPLLRSGHLRHLLAPITARSIASTRLSSRASPPLACKVSPPVSAPTPSSLPPSQPSYPTRFDCHVCGRSFSQLRRLKKHTRSHPGQSSLPSSCATDNGSPIAPEAHTQVAIDTPVGHHTRSRRAAGHSCAPAACQTATAPAVTEPTTSCDASPLSPSSSPGTCHVSLQLPVSPPPLVPDAIISSSNAMPAVSRPPLATAVHAASAHSDTGPLTLASSPAVPDELPVPHPEVTSTPLTPAQLATSSCHSSPGHDLDTSSSPRYLRTQSQDSATDVLRTSPDATPVPDTPLVSSPPSLATNASVTSAFPHSTCRQESEIHLISVRSDR
ncbi:proline-rich protein 36-like [Stegodyphus dumicola]|uniref:proline-rich protein 36-like n=1 Tax=Stegodyphus dumicola TaxID=202533 RepID=UPI0015AA60ED|nr:proline-rich protein 36-like [Stegodyphus dumicola]